MKRTISLLATVAIVITVLGVGGLFDSPAAVNVAAAGEPFLDVTRSFEERAADLVSRMTQTQKYAQFGSNNPSLTVAGYSIRGYDYWSEALHGVARQGRATSFPYSIAMAATWDPELVLAMNEATANEARGKNNQNNGNFQGRGLNYFSPTINLARDPRWGRTHESYSEDPYLTAIIGQAFVSGFQGDDERYEKVNATIKHYAANNSEWDRHTGSADMDNRTLLEFYTRAFKDVLLNVPRTGSVMTSYNRVNNIPSSANPYLVDELLRRRWGFGGFVVSDCGAIEQVYLAGNHGNLWRPREEYSAAYLATLPKDISAYTNTNGRLTPTGGSALSLLAGTDLNCGPAYVTNGGIRNAFEAGLITQGDIDVALVRVFTSRFRTGEFDPKEMVPYRQPAYYENAQLENAAYKQLAEDSSDQAIVLLKNEPAAGGTAPILPLDKSKKNVVMVGDIANMNILGDYSGSPSAANLSTPMQGVERMIGVKPYLIQSENLSEKQYVCNSGVLRLRTATNSTLRTIQSSASSEHTGCRLETSTNIGYISPGASMVYKNLNLFEATQLTFATSGNAEQCSHGLIEFHLGSLGGPLLTTVTSAATSGWSSYVDRAGVFTEEALEIIAENPTQDVWVIFNPTLSVATLSPEQLDKVKTADYVIACVGTFEGDSHENNDRQSVTMLRGQEPLVEALSALNPNIVVYIQAVNMVKIESFKDKVPAILWTCYNGQAQGNAMARVLYGERNPGAKLPFTWYSDEKQLPAISDYAIRPIERTTGTGASAVTAMTNGRTYQYFHGDVTFPFGFGLTYTTFAYSNMGISAAAVTPNDTVTVTVDVENTGDMDGAEIVQLYAVAPEHDGLERPFRQLRGFSKVNLAAGEKKTVTIELDMSELYFYNEAGAVVYDPGEYTIEIGASSDDIKFTKTLTLSGERNLTLQTVSAAPGAVVLNSSGGSVKANLSAVLVDDTFLDLSDEDVTVVYASSAHSIATVDANGTVTAKSPGVCTISGTVFYNGSVMSATFPLVIQGTAAPAITLTDIAVTAQPVNKSYISGQKFDSKGMIVTATYNDGFSAPVAGYTVSPAGGLTVGTTEVTVSFTEGGVTKTAKVTGITVEPNTLDKITVTRPPAKTSYIAGQAFDPAGIVVTASYINGVSMPVTDLAFSPAGPLAAGTTEITVSYTDNGITKTAAVAVTVIEKASVKIEVLTPPAKTAYKAGETFDSAGLTLSLVFNDDSKETVSAGFTVSPDGKLTAEDDKVTVSYGGHEVDIAITVVYKAPLGVVSGGEQLRIDDARMVLQYLVDKIIFDEDQLDRADVDGVGGVTISDARLILQMLVGKITEFPRKED
ncbi:MAG: glycoside hydrolase family 3 C-terminal domain-containing protein [Oscillospiraceae bacterium]|nr:glycoside hydrolase family 3 C-terminal domain-containing protein [Oscillospiraceae bacterium]